MITSAAEAAISRVAKSMYYKDRTLERILELSNDQSAREECTAELHRKLEQVRRDVKRDDAILLLSRLGGQPKDELAGAQTEFPRTSFWTKFEHKHVYPHKA